MGELGLGRPGRRDPARRGAPRDELAFHDRGRDDARAVEDGVPGRDRCGLRDDRLLALQRLLRAGALPRAAGEQSGHVEPDGIPRARGLHLRDLAVQLHGDRRQSHHRAGADGQHDRVEACGNGDAERLLHAAGAGRSRPASGRDQPRAGRLGADHRDPARFSGARGRAFHRQHRGLQQPVEDGRGERGQVPRLPAAGRRDRRQGLHRGAPSADPAAMAVAMRAAASSIRDRSARPRAASMSRSRCGTRSAIARSR